MWGFYLLSERDNISGDDSVDRTDLELSSEHIIGVTLIEDLVQWYATNMDIIDINNVIKLTRIVKETSQS